MKERGAATVSINVSILMGRLTHEPELRHTKDGTAVCNFCIAADLGFGDSKRTSYVDCVAWRGQAEFVSKYQDTYRPGALRTETGANGNRWR